MTSILPLITGSAGALVVLAIVSYLFFEGKLHSDSEFSKLVTEWRPITATMLIAVPFFALAFSAVWLLGRSGRRTPIFHQAVLIVLAFGAIDAVRNVSWFGLAAIMLLPAVAGQGLGHKPAAPRRTSPTHVLPWL